MISKRLFKLRVHNFNKKIKNGEGHIIVKLIIGPLTRLTKLVGSITSRCSGK